MKKFVLSAALLFLPWRGMLKAFHLFGHGEAGF